MDALAKHTAKFVEDHSGRAAFAEATNLLGCALRHPEGFHFRGFLGEHTLSTALRFAVQCRRWIKLKKLSSANLVCALEFEKDEELPELPPCASTLKRALDQIIHSEHVLITDATARLVGKKANKWTALQRKYYSEGSQAVLLLAETDDNALITIPLIVLLDAYFPLLQSQSRTNDNKLPKS